MAVTRGELMDPRNPTPVSLEEYLRTHYRPDRDWIEGRTLERNWCELPHSSMQGTLICLLAKREEEWEIGVLPSIRMQVAEDRYRICDVCAVRASDRSRGIVRTAPVLCVEVLAPEDGMSAMLEKVDDYLGMGDVTVWIVDPARRRAYCAVGKSGLVPVSDVLLVPGTGIRVLVSDVFEDMAEAGLES